MICPDVFFMPNPMINPQTAAKSTGPPVITSQPPSNLKLKFRLSKVGNKVRCVDNPSKYPHTVFNDTQYSRFKCLQSCMLEYMYKQCEVVPYEYQKYFKDRKMSFLRECFNNIPFINKIDY